MASSAQMAVFLVGAALDIFQTLILDLDTEGRYLFLNAIANQLRYPNNHTHYFAFILLYLFAELNQVRESIWTVFYYYAGVFCCLCRRCGWQICDFMATFEHQILNIFIENLYVM